MKEQIIQIALPLPFRALFDYLPPDEFSGKILKGMRVVVPFGKSKKIIGVVMGFCDKSQYSGEIKKIISVLDQKPILDSAILKLIEWGSDYYHHPIGEVVGSALPSVLRKKEKTLNEILKPEPITTEPEVKINKPDFSLNQNQIDAIETIEKTRGFKVFLLDGVTGSGKTEVYLNVLAKVLQLGKQALVLVPEINLTPQTVLRFKKRFETEIAVLHSRLTEKERACAWIKAQTGQAKIIIGTRSAIFVSLKNCGVIVLDEEHDSSFKQQSGFRYNARDLAIIRAKINNIPVILGSATPSFESVNNVLLGKYQKLSLPIRAGFALKPTFHILDIRGKKLQDGLSLELISQIKKHLELGGQALIFVNRRGFAPVFLCHKCGWIMECKNCDTHLIFHRNTQNMQCHHCGTNYEIPKKCPNCSEENLVMVGVGTERLENSFKKIFPESILTRVDQDTTQKKESMEGILKKIHQEKFQILIGTQMLAKGHHFPDVTLVAILNIDNGLFSSNFRANENLAQLIIQVSGRAGREQKPGEVYLQTHNPNHPFLLNLVQKGYWDFARFCLEERKKAQLPPYSYLALLRVEARNKDDALNFLKSIHQKMLNFLSKEKDLKILGPIPVTPERQAGKYRTQMLIQSSKRPIFHQKIDLILATANQEQKTHKKIRWYLEVDPWEI